MNVSVLVSLRGVRPTRARSRQKSHQRLNDALNYTVLTCLDARDLRNVPIEVVGGAVGSGEEEEGSKGLQRRQAPRVNCGTREKHQRSA